MLHLVIYCQVQYLSKTYFSFDFFQLDLLDMTVLAAYSQPVSGGWAKCSLTVYSWQFLIR